MPSGCGGEKLIEPRAIEKASICDDGADARRVADVGQRVGIQKNEVGELVFGDGAERVRQAEIPRRIHRRGL